VHAQASSFSREATNRLTVHHFGPDPDTIGGMATAIRMLTEHSIGADLVRAHSTWRPGSSVPIRPIAASLLALTRIRRGHIAHIHLSERGSFLREGLLAVLAGSLGLTVVVTLHGAVFTPFARRHPRLVSAVLRRAHLILCLDRGVLEVVRERAPQVRCEILPNPAVIDKDACPVNETGERVVFAGEIGLRKGADVLQRAWRVVAQRRPQAQCLLVGPLADFCPRDTERLEVRPSAGIAEMKDILRQARVVVLPARAEGMPMILTEAMSLGRPFVSTPVGAIPDLAAGEGGVLVPVENSSKLADRITELLADPELARKLGERGQAFCARTRSVEVIDDRLRQLYAETARGARDRRSKPGLIANFR